MTLESGQAWRGSRRLILSVDEHERRWLAWASICMIPGPGAVWAAFPASAAGSFQRRASDVHLVRRIDFQYGVLLAKTR